jgi:hypothetical protein
MVNRRDLASRQAREREEGRPVIWTVERMTNWLPSYTVADGDRQAAGATTQRARAGAVAIGRHVTVSALV